EQRLEAEYYDTGDLRLIRAGATLRRRVGGEDAGWHMKLPAGPGTRREIRLPLGDGDTVPAELAGLVLGYTRGEPLRPVARIATRRQRLILLGRAGESLAEVAADDVSAQTMGESTTVSQWHEVEVELTGGDHRLLEAAGEMLRRDGLRPSEWAAKLEHALGRRLATQPARSLSRSATAGQVILACLRDQTGRLTSLDPMVRMHEPDSVHKMRVTTRRLRSTLRSFRRVIGNEQTERLAAELRWLGRVLGAARDSEVLPEQLLTELGKLPADQVVGPVQARIRGHFAPVHAAAEAEVLTVLGSQRYFALLDALDRLIGQPPSGREADRPARDVLPAQVRRVHKRAARRMRRAWHAPQGPARDVALHRARKAVKRARYASEAVRPAAGKPARRFAKRMKRVQSVLGEHQDAVIAVQAVRQLGMSAHLAGENAFSYGLLYERESHGREHLQAQARQAWKKASRRRHRRWMS
ncbi:MAG TPA: CYTH and CHAD domain-containing protein, partial [Streptosporangiaceae bacterium]